MNESHSVLARSSNNKIAVVIRVIQQVIRAIFWYLFDNMIIEELGNLKFSLKINQYSNNPRLLDKFGYLCLAKFTADKIRGLFENSQINAPPFITRGADLVTNENLIFHNLPYLTLFYSTQRNRW